LAGVFAGSEVFEPAIPNIADLNCSMSCAAAAPHSSTNIKLRIVCFAANFETLEEGPN
jgi:hypothetical protein